MLSFRAQPAQTPQSNMYPQLPPNQQPNYYPQQPGAMQPYNPAGPSQPYQPQNQLQQTPQQPYQQGVTQRFGFGGGQQTAGGFGGPSSQVPNIYQPATGNQLQPMPQGPSQQGVQLQQSAQGVSQVQSGFRPAAPFAVPQPIESVNRTEDPIYGPLGRARGKVERAMRADEEISPDLADMLSTGTNETYVGPHSSGAAFRPLRITKTTPLPDALHQELNYKHLTAKMGLFEDIERAWFTVDNKLFLWDYADGRDFSRYDEQEETIQAVGLVKASKAVFVDDIDYLLVVCTSSKVTLLGLNRASPREINLYDTQISLHTPTPMLSIRGTNSGRIFMLGQDKDIYELDYRTQSGWYWGASTSRGSLSNKSAGQLSYITPSFLKSSKKEGVEMFTVDAVQNKLYTLSTRGDVEMFDVSAYVWESKGIYSQLKRFLGNTASGQGQGQGQGQGNRGSDVVTIHPVGGEESSKTCLVAVCRNGTRAYFSAAPFQVNCIRSPPSQNLSFSAQSFYSSGTLLGIQHDESGPSPTTSVTIIVPNSGRQSVGRENYDNTDLPIYQNIVDHVVVPSQVWTVVELPATNPTFCAKTQRRMDGIALNPLSRQATSEARQFLILATSGIYSAVMPRPVDMLSGEVEVEKETAIRIATNSFGRIQTAAMGILLGSAPDFKASDLSSAVASILISAGAPSVRDGPHGRGIVYSARHDGLALILSRFLRPIWALRVTALDLQRRQALGVPQKTLLDVQSRLEGLRGYLDEYPFPRHQAEGDVKLAWDQEELSLHGFGVLITQTIEAISFVLLLADYKISDIVAKCDPNLQGMLSNLTFQGLLTTTDGRDIAKKLVTALIEQQIGQELGIDTLSELLQQRCGSFCQPGDVVLYKAEESIRRAESSRDPVERNDYLNDSLRLFSKAAGNVAIARLQDVTNRYRSLGFTVGSIELPLRCAAELDPQDKALDYVRDGEHPADPRKALHAARMECYGCILQALSAFDEAFNEATARGNAEAMAAKRDEAYALAINCNDEMFHFYLYDWHVGGNLSEQLLDFETPYIERYLQTTSNNVEERRDLLWKYYARREEYLAASRALFELATRNNALPLNDRAYYLAQALTSAKSAASVGSGDVEFASNLQERIDVAQVQLEVARAIDMHGEMSQEEKASTLGRLDRELIGLDELYQGFARPYRLYEPILLILKTADTRIDDVCEAVWRQLLQQAAKSADGQGGQGIGRDAKVGEVIKELMRRYFPSDAAPPELVLPVIYDEAAGIRGAPGWASEALLDGGVPLKDLWEAVMGLMEESHDQGYFIEEAGILAERWTLSKDQIPAAEVERFASAYLLRTNDGDLDERTRITRERMGAAKAAAGPY